MKKRQNAGREKVKKIENEVEIEKKKEIKDEIKEIKKIEDENEKKEEETKKIEEVVNRLYENSFDNVIISAIKGKKDNFEFKLDEHKNIANNIITKYILISNAYLNNKTINEKDTDNYAEYRGIVNNIKDVKRPSQVDKILKIKLNDKEQQILSYYETNDRREIINILNEELFINAKKLIQTIYYPKSSNVDILAFEDIFKDNEKDANTFYNMVKDEMAIRQSDNDDKIKRIIESKIVIPIVNDFMWVDNINEIYPIDKSHKVKKESEEKIYYITNKIMESMNKLEIFDNSFIPEHLKYKNAIYYNSNENNDIIKDNIFTTNQLLKSQLQILIDHQQNPYFNLKSDKYFNYHFNNTLNAIRYVSISEKNNKFITKNHRIQTRTSSNDNFNIVGFMVFNGKYDEITYDDMTEISYKEFLDCISDKLNGKKFKGGYWMFSEKDKSRINNFNDNMENNVVCKTLTEILFDDVNNIHNEIIINNIKKASSYSEVMKIIVNEINKFYHNQINNNSPNSDIFTKNEYELKFIDSKIEEVENGIFEFLEKNNKTLEDKFTELYGYENAEKLKETKYVIPKKIINIDLTNEKYIEDNTVNELEGLTCQHHITWDDINNSFRNKDSNYQNLLSGFIAKYVETDAHGKYICKSCGEPIEIEDYVQEMTKSDGKLVVTSSVSVGRIEDDKRYKEFIGVDGVINGIKNNVIKVADFVNIPQYSIRSKKTENDINQITKDTIDLLQNTLSLWNNKYLEYNNTKETKYGINRVLSDLFIWPFDNNLYNNDTRYRDINKLNKQNNAILYVAINLINSLSKDQIINLTKTKDCNYSTYEILVKHMGIVKLQITKDQITPISNYPVLGYSIFNFAFNLVKYNRFIDMKGREKNSKLITELILRAMYTIIDIMNIVNLIYFEIKETNNNSDIFNFYQRYYLNFLQHLENIYSDTSFISSLRFDKNKQIVKTEYEDNSMKVSGKYEDYFISSKSFNLNDRQQYYSKFNVSIRNNSVDNEMLKYNDIKFDKTICCPDGKLHNWKNFEGGIKCENCEMTYEDVNKNKNYKNDLINNIKEEFLQELAKRYCFTAKKHAFELKNGKLICSLCNYVDGEKLSKDKIVKLNDNFYHTNIINEESNINNNVDIKIIDDYEMLNKEFKTLKDYLKKDNDDINESGVIINLDDVSYTINYSYNGNKIEPKILLKEQVQNEELDGKKVLTFKEKGIISYYDAISHKFIGYNNNNKFTKYTGLIDNKIIVNNDIKEFIENLFIPKNIIDVIYLSKEDVFNTYYNNISLFMNNLVKIINKINNKNDKEIKLEKIINFDSYLNNRSVVLDMIASSYNGNKTFNFDNKFNEVLRFSYDSIIKKFNKQNLENELNDVKPFENSIKMFKECDFIIFKTFSMIILLKALNSLLEVDSKISKQIIKLLVYTYLSSHHLDHSLEMARFVDELYAPNYSYGETSYYNDEEHKEDDDEDEEEGSDSEYEGMDIDKFRDVDEDGNIIEEEDDEENNIMDIDD